MLQSVLHLSAPQSFNTPFGDNEITTESTLVNHVNVIPVTTESMLKSIASVVPVTTQRAHVNVVETNTEVTVNDLNVHKEATNNPVEIKDDDFNLKGGMDTKSDLNMSSHNLDFLKNFGRINNDNIIEESSNDYDITNNETLELKLLLEKLSSCNTNNGIQADTIVKLLNERKYCHEMKNQAHHPETTIQLGDNGLLKYLLSNPVIPLSSLEVASGTCSTY